MVKESLFQFIHLLQKSRRSQTYFPITMYIINLAIHIIIYLSIPAFNILQIQTLVTSPVPVFVLFSFLVFICLQIIFYLLKRQQLYLSQQLSFFRFVTSPLLSLSLLQVVQNNGFSLPLGLIMFVLNKTASSVFSRAILYEIHRNYTLNIMETSIVFEFDTFEALLIANCFITKSQIQLIFALVTFLFSLYTAFKHFVRMESTDYQYRILYLTNSTHVLFSFYFVLLLMFDTITRGYFYAALLPILGVAVFLVYSKLKSTGNNISKAMMNELPFAQFISSIDCFLILTRQEYSSDKRNLVNYIYAIISQHESKCTMPGCELLSLSTQEELRLMSQKSIQQLIHKIMKKIQWILEEYHLKFSDDLIISFTFLKFYAEYLQLRVKMQNLLNEIDESALSWSYQLEYSKYKFACEDIQNIDNIDVLKDEQIYAQFQNTMVSTLNCMIEFWSEFGEEKVDLGKIMQISGKLFPFKARLQEIFDEQTKVQKFTTFQIMKLYGLYQQRILNKFEYAAKIEDIITILVSRLKDNQDMHYLSKESQAGFIVICLSQSKLGDIFMVNEKACDIFRYTKKEMLGLRVNAIMPSVFADIHDQILIDFLKKKRKKYNTDQRLLFGKDGNGYLFPVLLQLQRASFSSNDEYIFIASVAPSKVRSAPVFCIIDHEGNITDYSASFRNIFFSNNKKTYNKNIQEIIPGYFDQGYTEKTEQVRVFTSILRNKKLGEVEVRFQISPLIVKSVHEGYLVKMTHNNERTVSSYSNLCLTENIKALLLKNQIRSTQNNYNHLTNTYQFQKVPHLIDFSAKSNQFTLPFLNYQDMAFFANPTEIKRFGKDIKTIRFINNHFQRIDDDHSFHSESFTDEDKVDIRAKIDELKHKFSRKQEKSLTNNYKIIANAFIILSIVICVLIYEIYLDESTEEEEFLALFDSQKQILYYLPEYIISFTCAQNGINRPFFENHLLEIKPILIKNILDSDIQQNYKEDIMKIIYLKSPDDLVGLLETNTFTIEEEDSKVQRTLQIYWGILIGVCFLLLIFFILLFYHFSQVLFSIYTLFLSLKQSQIKRIEESCKYLIEKIYFQTQSTVERQQEKKGNEEDVENQIEKIKQFKNMTRKQDIFTFLKMSIPILIIIAFLFGILFISSQQFELFQTMKLQHNKMFQSIPTASIQITKIILKILDSIILNIDNQYEASYQQLQLTIIQFDQNAKRTRFLDVIYGNVCQNSKVITQQMLLSCNNIGNGILKTGISSTMNFIAQGLKNITNKNSVKDSTIQLIFQLQFSFLNPALLQIQDQMQEILISDIRYFSSFYTSMIALLIFFFVLYDLYIIIFPLKTIEAEIKHTNQMINLMPDHNSNEAGPTTVPGEQ